MEQIDSYIITWTIKILIISMVVNLGFIMSIGEHYKTITKLKEENEILLEAIEYMEDQRSYIPSSQKIKEIKKSK